MIIVIISDEYMLYMVKLKLFFHLLKSNANSETITHLRWEIAA